MARLGTALGWPHYSAGWHATCTAGAPASAAGAAVALGLPAEQIAVAMALAVPAAGGVQRAFGTDAKSLQVGFAVDAGIRAARLAAAGAQADPVAVDAWLALVGGDPAAVDPSGPSYRTGWRSSSTRAVMRCSGRSARCSELAGPELDPAGIRRIVLRTPEATVVPLIHHRPDSGLQGKFSLEYAAAAALLDARTGVRQLHRLRGAPPRRPAAGRPGRDQARPRRRAAARRPAGGGDPPGAGAVLEASQQFPPGSPAVPPTRPSSRPSCPTASAASTPTRPAGPGTTRPGLLRRYLP